MAATRASPRPPSSNATSTSTTRIVASSPNAGGITTVSGSPTQLGTVRFLGTFLADLTEVPSGVVAHLARQLGIADTDRLEALRDGRETLGPCRRDPPSATATATSIRAPSPLPCPAGSPTGPGSVPNGPASSSTWPRPGWSNARSCLPGVTVLARLVAQVRDKAASRLWRTLARALKPRQAARLETLLVADEVSRQSPLERLRRAPDPGQHGGPGRGAATAPGDPGTGGEPHRPVRRAARAGPCPGAVRRRGTGASHRPDVAAPPPGDPPRLRQGPGDRGP